MIKVEKKILLPDIEIQIDENARDSDVKAVTEEWGKNIPIIQINDNVLPFGDLLRMEVNVLINDIPQIELLINDQRQLFSTALKTNDNNKLLIFFGNEEYYHKFECLIINTEQNVNSDKLHIAGTLNIEPLLETEQKTYPTISDMLIQIATDSEFGYFENPNDDLTKEIELLNPNETRLNFLMNSIYQYTNNIWSLDNNYILHVGNLKSFLDKPISKFNYFENKKLQQPIDILLSNNVELNKDDDNEKQQINGLQFVNYSINHSKDLLKKSYLQIDESANEKLLFENDYGIGKQYLNFYSGFKSINNYQAIIKKQFLGNYISLLMENILLEIYPFQVVNVELVKFDDENKPIINKQKRIIIGYSFIYQKNKKSKKQRIKQIIKLI